MTTSEAQQEHELIWTMETAHQLEEATTALADPRRPSDDVFSAIGLAQLAYRIAVGEASERDWPTEEADE